MTGERWLEWFVDRPSPRVPVLGPARTDAQLLGRVLVTDSR
jgi:hypothetical protein